MRTTVFRLTIPDLEHATLRCSHRGKTCRKGAPAEETCMVLGEGARFLVRRGSAHEKSKEEMLAILEHAKSLGMTHVTDNIRDDPPFFCNCCRC